MKGQGKLTVIIAGAVIFAVGVIFAAIGDAHGGNFFRAMEHAGNGFYMDTDRGRSGAKHRDGGYPYDYGYGDKDDDYEDIEEFFREFGLSDEEIEQFLYPGSSSGSGRIYY